jgi:hypothetical protein
MNVNGVATVDDLLQGNIDVVHLANLDRMTASSTHFLSGLGHNIRQRIDDVAKLIAGAGMDMGGMGFCFHIRLTHRRLGLASGNEQRDRRNGDHRRDS